MKTLVARTILKVLAGRSPWAETCSQCKGYPADHCDCNWDVRVRRWARRNLR